MGYGKGSVHFAKKRNRWVAAVEVRTPTGERKRKTFTCTTEAEALAKLDAYRQENPAPHYDGRVNHMDRARRVGTHTERQWIAMGKACGWLCAYCGRPTTLASAKTASNHREKDHRVPVSRGGSDDIANIAVSCHECNARKGRMTDVEFQAWSAQ